MTASKRSAIEWVAAAGICLLLTILVIDQKFAAWYEFQGDTAMFYQSVQNIAARGVPFTNIGETSIWLHEYQPVRLTAAQLSSDPLPPSPVAEINILRWHSYFVLYPIALLTFVLSPPQALVGTYVLCFVGALLFAYVLIRRRGVPVAGALLYCAFLVTYPAWSQGLAGQFYPDRLFVIVGLAFMFAVSTRRSPMWLQVVLGLACASITERGALIAGIAALAYQALSWRTSEQRYFRTGLGVALLAIAFAEFHSLINTENGQYMLRSVHEFQRWVARPRYIEETLLFFLVNAPMLVVALFDRRRAAVAIVLMLPNVFGTINGNEKIGWTTSYHSYYMPALILASATGYARAYARATTLLRKSAVVVALAALVAFEAMLNPYAYQRVDIHPANVASSFIPQAVAFVRTAGGARPDGTVDAAIQQAVPEGALITAVEPAMPILYHRRNIQFYPLGIDQAAYAVLTPTMESDGKRNLFGGFLTYRGPDEQRRVDAVLFARLRRDGYDVDHPQVLASAGGLVVVKHSKMILRDR